MNTRFHDCLASIHRLRDRFRCTPPNQAKIDRLTAEWSWAAVPGEQEWLVLCTLDGTPTGAFAPRWLAHLLGIPHCTAHVGLAAPGGFIVLQRRSRWKAQFPDCWDMAVTGHVSIPAVEAPHPVSYLEAAARELEEEMGLPVMEQAHLLEAPGLAPIGNPTAYFGASEVGDRPWYDVEVRQLFGAVLTPAGLARLSYPEDEISGVLLCRPAEALRLTGGPEGAAGAAGSVADLTAWLASRGK